MLKLVLVALWMGILATAPAQAGLTLVQRETFQGIGTRTAAAPGNLGAVTGTFNCRPVGPRLKTDTTVNGYGWSADAQGQPGMSETCTAANLLPASAYGDAGLFCVDFWVFNGRGLTDGNHDKTLFQLGNSAFTLMEVVVQAADSATILTSVGGTQMAGAPVQTPYTLPVNAWVQFRVAWQQIPTGFYEYNVAALYRTPGGAWMEICHAPDQKVFSALTFFKAGFVNTAGTGASNGRIGMRSGYAMGTWADRLAVAADVADPPTQPSAWYVNPATGNDANDGTSAATAWKTVGKINAESVNTGLIPTTAGYAAGDTLTIDTRTANLILGPTSLDLNTRGLNVVQLGGGLTGTGEVQAWTALPAAGWSLTAGASKTYQQILTETNLSCVAWEDDRWLNHVTAISFTGTATTPDGTAYGSVTAALEALPGSFWTDGTTLYLHPFGDSSPTSDGKAYTRSYNRNANGDSAVCLLAADIHLDSLRVRKTCLADMGTNNPVAAYCFQILSGGGGTSLIENCSGRYGGKHIFGFTDNGTARRLTVRSCTADQGSPYAGAGGQTPWVDYSGLTGDADNQTTYFNCSTTVTTGLIGSTAGQTMPNVHSTWLSHNNGSGRQFSLLRWVDCSFDSTMQDLGAAMNGAIQMVGTTCAGLSVNSPGATVDRCKSTAYPFTSVSAGNGIAVTNSVVIASQGYYPLASPCAGTVSYIGCTVDMRNAISSDGPSTALLYRAGPLDLTWRDNVFLSANANTVIGNATRTDTINFAHNAYQTPNVARNFNDGSGPTDFALQQWQAIGYDSNSLSAADLSVLADGSLLFYSPAIDLGEDRGPSTDYTGAVFAVRNDAGAFEYALPAPRRGPVATQATEGATIILTEQAVGNGPFSYQWLRNGVPVAGATGASLTLANVRAGQSGSYSVVITNAAGSVTDGPAAVLVSPATFSDWQAGYFSPAELADETISGPLADPDADGVCNLLEYAFGGDPKRADAAASVLPTLLTAADGPHAAVTFRRLINAVSVVYTVESSPDLGAWTAVDTTLVGLPLGTGDLRTEWVTARLTAPVSASPGGRQFLRVRVDGN